MALLILGLWAIRTTASLLTSTYYWQLKEYRWDRMREFLSQQRSAQVFFSHSHLILLLSLAAYFLVELLSRAENPLKGFIVPLMGTLFLAEVLQASHQFMIGKLKRPKPTSKALLILLISFLVEALIPLTIFLVSSMSFDEVDLALSLGIVALLEHDLQAAVILMIVNPLSSWQKQRIFLQARDKRSSLSKLKVIGITGSFGKTSVKEYVTHILEGQFQVLKTEANTNTEIGIAQTILNRLKPEHEVFVCEMGAYKVGEIKICSRIAQPQLGIFTGLNEQHVALFGSVDKTFQAKWELMAALPADGVGIFNGDCEALRSRIRSFRGKALICRTDEASGMVKDLMVLPDRISFSFQGQVFEAPLLGHFQIVNLLMAINAAIELGMALPAIAERVKTIEAPDKTMELKGFEHGIIIDDSYNVNPDGLKAALEHLKQFEGYKKIIFFPGILELGDQTEEIHKELGQLISHEVDYAFFTDESFSEQLSLAALQGGLTRDHIFCTSDNGEILDQLQKLFGAEPSQKWVLLFESRGAEGVLSELMLE